MLNSFQTKQRSLSNAQRKSYGRNCIEIEQHLPSCCSSFATVKRDGTEHSQIECLEFIFLANERIKMFQPYRIRQILKQKSYWNFRVRKSPLQTHRQRIIPLSYYFTSSKGATVAFSTAQEALVFLRRRNGAVRVDISFLTLSNCKKTLPTS